MSTPPLSGGLFELKHINRQWRLTHICRWRNHVPRRLSELTQFFVWHFLKSRSQLVDVEADYPRA
jgi:hypothetical protein